VRVNLAPVDEEGTREEEAAATGPCLGHLPCGGGRAGEPPAGVPAEQIRPTGGAILPQRRLIRREKQVAGLGTVVGIG
jgi:hypothetical protein